MGLFADTAVAFFFNYLDRAAFANGALHSELSTLRVPADRLAYVAGLRDDLGLTGIQYSNLLSILTAGYVLGQYPHSLIIIKIRPSIWLPSMVVVWAILTACMGAVHTYAELMVLRFLQGIVEASTYCGAIYVIGSWMKPMEIAKRTALFTAAGQR
jgi:ACS family pantothenate transporter-like MFS transporter